MIIMAQFEVPQFIDVESKIVGPLTLKQFAFVAIPVLVCFFLFFILNTFLWVVVTVLFVSTGAAFAFIKVNGRPLYTIVLMGITFFWKPKLFLWRRPVVEEIIDITTPKQDIQLQRRALQYATAGLSQVNNLWRDLTTRKTPIPKREKSIPRRPVSEIQEQYQVFKRITGEKQVAKRIDYR